MATPTLTDALRETLACFEEGGAPRTTSEVAEELDLGRRSTYDRLNRLVDQGRLETKKVGGNGRVWWQPDGMTENGTEAIDENREFEQLVESVEEYAIFTLDTGGYVQTWNPGAERIKGYEADEILGDHFSRFYTEDDRESGVPESNLEAAATDGFVEDEGWRVRADGSRFWANVTITAIHDDEGALQGFAKVTRDMTDRRKYEEELRQQRDYTRELLETAPVGVVTVDPDGAFETANRKAEELLGLDEDDEQAVGVRAVYGEDGEFVPPSERPHLRAFETGESVRNWHGQIELSNGGRRWLAHNVEPMTDGDGEVERLLVTLEDITQLKEQARRLQRRREDLEAEIEDVFERVDDGFVALDGDFRFTYVNDHAAELLDRSDTELVDEYIWDVLQPGPEIKERYETALAEQEPDSFEVFFEQFDAWFEEHVYPSENGLSVYFRDVTERKERERELKQYETLFTESRDVNVVLEPDGTYRYVTPSMERELGHDPDALVGENAFEYVHPEDRERVAEVLTRLAEEPDLEPSIEYRFRRADGSWAVIESRGKNLLEDPAVEGLVVYSRDVTERKERERELERAIELFHRTEDIADVGGWEIDPETMDVFWSENLFELLGMSPGGEPPLEEAQTVYHEDDRPIVEQAIEDALEDGEDIDVEARFQRPDGELRWAHVRGVPQTEDGEVVSLRGAFQDITERKRFERERETRIRQQEVVARLGQTALEDGELDTLFDEAARLVAETLGNDYCKVLDLRPDEEELLLRQGVGWDEGIVGKATVSAHEADSQAAYTLAHDEPIVVEDLTSESRFSGPELLTSHDVKSGISVVIGPHDDPWGILGTHDTEAKEFTSQDVNFVQSVTNTLATAIERHRNETELRRQREQLAALNNINEIVRDITEAVIERPTRSEIEDIVCDRLAATDSYAFAWIGDVDVASQSVEVRAEGGAGDYLDDVTISVDSEDERGQGPTGRAFQTGEVQTTEDLLTDECYEPWREQARKHGFRSSAAIPLVHEETLYGVLNVYADRSDAFEGNERRVISQLGEIVGHAIAAADRKQALMSDEVVELEFLLDDVSEIFETDQRVEGPLEFERSVQIDDETFLQYGTVAEGSLDALRSMVGQVPSFEEVTVLGQDTGSVRFELRLSEPPITATVAAHGGQIRTARIEDDEFHLMLHLPPSVSARNIIEQIQEAYPSTELRTRQQTTRDDESVDQVYKTVTDELTDRQQTVLEAATYAGFFEWPRESSGEEVAASLDIAPPTFSQHLRKAQRKVFTSLFQRN